MSYICYTDGAATMKAVNGHYLRLNGGWAFGIVDEDNENFSYFENGGSQSTTNNEMELTAIYKAIQWYLKNGDLTQQLIIHSDSKYSINCITSWANKWKANDWKKKGGEIQNLELIKAIHEWYNSYDICFEKVKGHSDNKYNEAVDRLAVMAKEKMG